MFDCNEDDAYQRGYEFGRTEQEDYCGRYHVDESIHDEEVGRLRAERDEMADRIEGPDGYVEEVERLRAELATPGRLVNATLLDLENEVERLRAQVKSMRGNNKKLRDQNGRCYQERERLRAESDARMAALEVSRGEVERLMGIIRAPYEKAMPLREENQRLRAALGEREFWARCPSCTHIFPARAEDAATNEITGGSE